jgi:ABC-type lipopolysaccharide export system ATPase subunit
MLSFCSARELYMHSWRKRSRQVYPYEVLFGIYKKDEGEILLDGVPVEFENPRQALEHGVSMVHQELIKFWKEVFSTIYG